MTEHSWNEAQRRLFQTLDDLNIRHDTITHAPVFTVAESRALLGTRPGGHFKNLFLKNKKGAMALVVSLDHRTIDLKALHRALGLGNVSFARPELLLDVLGVLPGSVSPFALINTVGEHAMRVMMRVIMRVIIDAQMMAYAQVNFHPLKNDATTTVCPQDLLRFIQWSGHTPELVDLSPYERIQKE